mmetsp:Transcript_6610/g.14646  ORF Transcript_6610/g.14646 Transcript_6610/m.14646 type:complete len:210 (+) Transcript_6610:912-1541(+)
MEEAHAALSDQGRKGGLVHSLSPPPHVRIHPLQRQAIGPIRRQAGGAQVSQNQGGGPHSAAEGHFRIGPPRHRSRRPPGNAPHQQTRHVPKMVRLLRPTDVGPRLRNVQDRLRNIRLRRVHPATSRPPISQKARRSTIGLRPHQIRPLQPQFHRGTRRHESLKSQSLRERHEQREEGNVPEEQHQRVEEKFGRNGQGRDFGERGGDTED